MASPRDFSAIKKGFIHWGAWGVALSLFFIASLLFPPASDDYWHGFLAQTISGAPHFTTEHITCGSFIEACLQYREIHNSRLANCCAIFLCAFANRIFFALLNTIAFALLILFTAKEPFKKIPVTHIALFIILGALICPQCSGTLFWLSGACNYLWGSCLLCLFIHVLFKALSRPHPLSGFLPIAALCFTCSLWHEAIAFALIPSFVVQYLLCRQAQNRPLWVILAIVSVTAAACLLTAPGLWHRAHGESIFSISYIITAFLMMGYKCFFTLIAFFILLYKKRKTLLHDFCAIFSICNFFIALVIGAKGAWGGGYFYFSFSVFFWLLHSTSIGACLRNTKMQIVSAISALAILLYTCCLHTQIHHIMGIVVEKAKSSHIVHLDYRPSDPNIYFALRRCLSLPFDNNFYFTHAGIYHNVQNFFTIWNDGPHSNDIYNHITSQTEGFSVHKTPEHHIIIQLPQHWACDQLNAPTLRDSQGRLIKTRMNEYWPTFILTFLYQYFPSIYRAPAYADEHQGRYHLIIPHPTDRYTHITLGIFNIHTMEYQFTTIPILPHHAS